MYLYLIARDGEESLHSMSYPGTLTALVARDSKHLSCAHHDRYNKNTPLGKTSEVHVRPFRAEGKSSTVDRVATHSTSQFTSTTPRHVFRINDSDWTPPPFGLRESMFGLDHQRKMDCGMIAGPDGGHFHSHRVAANFDIPKQREMGCMARAEEGGGRSNMRVKDRDIRAAGTYEMSLRSRAKGTWYGKVTSRSGAVADCGGIPSSRNDLDLVEARAAASKKCRSRYAARWHEIATLHRLLETGSNRRPARNTLDIIRRVMRETSCENPSPGCLTRNQFICILSSSLDPCDRAGLQRLYSSFDPDGTNKMRFVELLACLMVTHKPEAEAFLEGLQQTFLRNLGAIGSELNEELTKGNRQVCWQFLRKLFKLFQTERPLAFKDVGRLFCICAASDSGFLQMSAAFATFLKEHPVHSLEKIVTEDTFEDIFSTQFALLDLFNTQMSAVQAFVKRTLPSN